MSRQACRTWHRRTKTHTRTKSRKVLASRTTRAWHIKLFSTRPRRASRPSKLSRLDTVHQAKERLNLQRRDCVSRNQTHARYLVIIFVAVFLGAIPSELVPPRDQESDHSAQGNPVLGHVRKDRTSSRRTPEARTENMRQNVQPCNQHNRIS